MPLTPANSDGIELFYETFGEPDGVPLLFVMGLGAQLHVWDREMLQAFVDRGFYTIRFDNRDVGLSTKPDVGEFDVSTTVLGAFSGQSITAPYLLSDMANDAASLLDHLGISAAHVIGASMGGMISQQLAIDHPSRVLSLTSIMSTTGDPDVGQPDPTVLPVLLPEPVSGRDAVIAQGVAASRAISGPLHFDEGKARERAEISFDRCFYPAGVGHQLLAILASGSRSEGLAKLNIPALVVHGNVDPLVTPSGGERTAEVIPGAELLMMEDMGHDLPEVTWPQLVERITRLAAEAAPLAS